MTSSSYLQIKSSLFASDIDNISNEFILTMSILCKKVKREICVYVNLPSIKEITIFKKYYNKLK